MSTFSKPTEITKSVKDFLKRSDIREYLNDKNFQKIYEQCDSLDITELTEILLYITQSPEAILQNMDYVPPTMFVDNKKLTTITIPNTVDYIGKSAFKYCTNLSNVTFEGNTMYQGFGPSAFRDCASLTEFTLMPDYRLDELPSNCFKNCTSLKTVDLSNNTWIRQLGRGCFEGCTNLRTVLLPETLTELDTRCFCDCTSLRQIYLPKGIDLYSDCFRGCTSLKTVYYNGDLEDWNKSNGHLSPRNYTWDLIDDNTGEVLIQKQN